MIESAAEKDPSHTHQIILEDIMGAELQEDIAPLG